MNELVDILEGFIYRVLYTEAAEYERSRVTRTRRINSKQEAMIRQRTTENQET